MLVNARLRHDLLVSDEPSQMVLPDSIINLLKDRFKERLQTTNLKHKAILMTIYSAGLPISVAVNLKIEDIDSNCIQIRVEQAKGKKHR